MHLGAKGCLSGKSISRATSSSFWISPSEGMDSRECTTARCLLRLSVQAASVSGVRVPNLNRDGSRISTGTRLSRIQCLMPKFRGSCNIGQYCFWLVYRRARLSSPKYRSTFTHGSGYRWVRTRYRVRTDFYLRTQGFECLSLGSPKRTQDRGEVSCRLMVATSCAHSTSKSIVPSLSRPCSRSTFVCA
jgi:hypothetical protein